LTEALIALNVAQKIHRTTHLQTHALNGVSLRIQAGEFVAVTGPSGCGKSTLLSILGLLDTLDGGSYQWQGQNVASLGAAERAAIRNRQLGFVFQNFHLLPELSAVQNVALPLQLAGVAKQARLAAAHVMLERVGLAARANHRPGQLSGGQQQRVAIARAMVHQPQLVLADEPTGNLDSASGAQVLALLEELSAGGCTLVLVTHAAEVAARAGRRMLMQDGTLVG
jgi:putative ABC transport system ATP-binding protein